MADKTSLAIAVIAILISAGGIAYTSSAISSVSTQISQLEGKITNQVNSKIGVAETSVNSVRQEQSAIRNLVEQKIGGLEKTLQEAQTRLAQAEKSAQQSQTELQQLKADQALEEAAKKEKPPVVYGIIDAPDFANILWPRFRESYPWTPTSGNYIEGFTPLRARFISEFKAGAPSADLVWQTKPSMLTEMAEYMDSFPGMRFVGLYSDAMFSPSKQNPSSFTSHVQPAVIIYNTKLVKDEDAPKSWFDLTNPKWKGKIIMADPKRMESTAQILADLLIPMKQDRWNSFISGLVANQPFIVGGITEGFARVVSGEFAITIGLLNDVLAAPSDAPIKVAWPKEEPKSVPLGGAANIGISKKATNPNFAKLFLNWLLSPAGQRALASTGRPPALLTVEHPNSLAKVMPPGVDIIPANEDFFKNPKNWQDTFKARFP